MNETTVTKNSHTPGPWEARIARIHKDDEPFGFSVTAAGKAVPIAAIGVAYDGIAVLHRDYRHQPWAAERYTPEELESNARLIANAPELLGLLRRIVVRDGLNDNQWFWLHDCKELLKRIDGADVQGAGSPHPQDPTGNV